jgi:zona occludens toxin
MSATVITGLPGAGKTALCVQKLLMPMAAKGWKESAITAEGEAVEVTRKVYTNINGLLLEHEKIDASHLNTWHEWAEPGSLIVFDEVQKPWPLTATGSKKPPYIEALETHRHKGVDFIVLTQHPMLIDANLCRLSDKHLHVRKVGNSRYATVYEWDGVSRTLLYKNAMKKEPYRRSKEVEGVYKSSALHTKQKRSMPTVVFALVIALVLFGAGFYFMKGRFHDRFFGAADKAAEVRNGSSQNVTKSAGDKGAQEPLNASSAPVPLPAGEKLPDPVYAGCAASKDRCTCYDSKGAPMQRELDFCKVVTLAHRPPPLNLSGFVVQEQERHRAELAAMAQPDTELLAFARARETAERSSHALASQPLTTAKPVLRVAPAGTAYAGR